MPEIAALKFTVLFAGGGTGGHLMPGLSVAEELRRRCAARARLVFVGTESELERRMVEGRDFEYLTLPSLKYTGSALRAPAWAMRSAGGLWAARRLVAKVGPDVIASLGGHAALAPSLAGALADIPIAAMEQNAIPGKVSKLLSWWAREVYVPWPGIESLFAHPDRVYVTGNPIRSELLQRPARAPAAVKFGLDPHKKTLLVMGGSQGARFINRAVTESLPQLDAESDWLQVIHGAGALHAEEVRAAYAGRKVRAAVLPFIDDMASAYAACDLALCRAGGTTLAELTALGVPASLVPLPIAANDHQRRNASFVAGAGAAFLLEQEDLSGGRLMTVLVNLLRNETCLARMRAASARLGRPAATLNVVNRLLGLLPAGPAGEAVLPAAAQGD